MDLKAYIDVYRKELIKTGNKEEFYPSLLSLVLQASGDIERRSQFIQICVRIDFVLQTMVERFDNVDDTFLIKIAEIKFMYDCCRHALLGSGSKMNHNKVRGEINHYINSEFAISVLNHQDEYRNDIRDLFLNKESIAFNKKEIENLRAFRELTASIEGNFNEINILIGNSSDISDEFKTNKIYRNMMLNIFFITSLNVYDLVKKNILTKSVSFRFADLHHLLLQEYKKSIEMEEDEKCGELFDVVYEFVNNYCKLEFPLFCVNASVTKEDFTQYKKVSRSFHHHENLDIGLLYSTISGFISKLEKLRFEDRYPYKQLSNIIFGRMIGVIAILDDKLAEYYSSGSNVDLLLQKCEQYLVKVINQYNLANFKRDLNNIYQLYNITQDKTWLANIKSLLKRIELFDKASDVIALWKESYIHNPKVPSIFIEDINVNDIDNAANICFRITEETYIYWFFNYFAQNNLTEENLNKEFLYYHHYYNKSIMSCCLESFKIKIQHETQDESFNAERFIPSIMVYNIFMMTKQSNSKLVVDDKIVDQCFKEQKIIIDTISKIDTKMSQKYNFFSYILFILLAQRELSFLKKDTEKYGFFVNQICLAKSNAKAKLTDIMNDESSFSLPYEIYNALALKIIKDKAANKALLDCIKAIEFKLKKSLKIFPPDNAVFKAKDINELLKMLCKPIKLLEDALKASNVENFGKTVDQDIRETLLLLKDIQGFINVNITELHGESLTLEKINLIFRSSELHLLCNKEIRDDSFLYSKILQSVDVLRLEMIKEINRIKGEVQSILDNKKHLSSSLKQKYLDECEIMKIFEYFRGGLRDDLNIEINKACKMAKSIKSDILLLECIALNKKPEEKKVSNGTKKKQSLKDNSAPQKKSESASKKNKDDKKETSPSINVMQSNATGQTRVEVQGFVESNKTEDHEMPWLQPKNNKPYDWLKFIEVTKKLTSYNNRKLTRQDTIIIGKESHDCKVKKEKSNVKSERVIKVLERKHSVTDLAEFKNIQSKVNFSNNEEKTHSVVTLSQNQLDECNIAYKSFKAQYKDFFSNTIHLILGYRDNLWTYRNKYNVKSNTPEEVSLSDLENGVKYSDLSCLERSFQSARNNKIAYICAYTTGCIANHHLKELKMYYNKTGNILNEPDYKIRILEYFYNFATSNYYFSLVVKHVTINSYAEKGKVLESIVESWKKFCFSQERYDILRFFKSFNDFREKSASYPTFLRVYISSVLLFEDSVHSVEKIAHVTLQKSLSYELLHNIFLNKNIDAKNFISPTVPIFIPVKNPDDSLRL